MAKMAKICRATNAIDVQVAKTEAEADALNSARRTALSALARVKPTTILKMQLCLVQKLLKWYVQSKQLLKNINSRFVHLVMLGMEISIQLV